jgi:Flp pilus assembly protein TadB
VTLLVLFILAVIWAAVLLPPYLQSRSESRPADSITSFQRQLSVLERRSGGQYRHNPYAPRPVNRSALALSRADARRRRRDVLFTLMGASGLTLVLAFFLQGPVWVLHLGVDLLLVAYVVLLVQAQQRATERQMKVRYLPRHAARPEPVLALRRSASAN